MNFRLSRAIVILLSVSFLLVLPSVLTAQEEENPLTIRPPQSSWKIGPTVMIGWNSHSGELGAGDSPLCLPVENGSGWGFGAGLSAEWTSDKNESWSFLCRLTYEERPGGSFIDRGPQPLPPPDPEHPVPRVNWSELSYSLVNVEGLFTQALFTLGSGTRFALAAGPAFQYVVRGHVRQGYETGEEKGICYDGEVPDGKPFRFSLKGGVQGDFPLFADRWTVTPGIYYDYALTDISSSESWRVHSLMFQVDVRTFLW